MSSYAGGPPPGEPIYNQAKLAAQSAFQRAQARLLSQRQGLYRQYGYTMNPDGSFGGVDAHNQYGLYQTMLRNQAGDDEHLREAQIGSGIEGGLANSAQENLRRAHGATAAQLGQGLEGGLADLQGQLDDAQDTYDQALYNGLLEATRNDISDQQYNPAEPPPADQAPPQVKAKPKPKAKVIRQVIHRRRAHARGRR